MGGKGEVAWLPASVWSIDSFTNILEDGQHDNK